jgi:asparagine synthase (glutamine-hydrolysing)
MCGIAGMVTPSPEPLLETFLSQAKLHLRSRGPDHFDSAKLDQGVHLLHTRLSIIDLTGGVQPMQDEDGAIVLNGEIYNYQELRDRRIEYRTTSDTEVVLKGMAARGLPFLNEVDGMFAFCYFDRHRRRLTLARDRFGIKPLYYYRSARCFAFSSTLQPLMVFSRKRINERGLAEYYSFRACCAPNTIFDDVYELKAGEALVFDIATMKIEQIVRWVHPKTHQRQIKDENDALELLDSNLRLAIKRHLVSDVPVATLLSGGVDSSIVTALAAQYAPSISAFTIGFEEDGFDESRYAAAVCRAHGIRHHVEYCNADAFLQHVDAWPAVMDDVVADPSAVFLYAVAQFVRDSSYKVVLSGEGADEMFCGYNQYFRFKLAKQFYKAGKYLPLLPSLIGTVRGSKSREIHFARQLSLMPHYYGAGLIFEPYLISSLLVRSFEVVGVDTLSAALDLDVARRLPDDILTRTDRATMHASVEARVPFLTQYVCAVADRCSEDLLLNGRQRKYILKKLAERYVPAECLYRRKVGFDLPLAKWFRNQLKERLLDNMRGSWQYDFINKDFFHGIVEDHMAGRNDNADKLWAFLLLEQNVEFLRSLPSQAHADRSMIAVD